MTNRIVYEQPLNERMRLFLRLDCMFRQAYYSLDKDSVWDGRAGMATLLDILSFFSRVDIKSEVARELERHAETLGRLERAPGVDIVRLKEVLDEVHGILERLYPKAQFGQRLRQNEFLSAISKRIVMPGGTCEFDLPAYHQWLQRPAEARIHDLQEWIEEFAPIPDAIALILALTRESAVPSREVAQAGIFQKNLDPNAAWQLVRVSVPAETRYFAEISGGKHRFTVRFMLPMGAERSVQAAEDVEFELACCVI
jgi:cell division protein ZapD